MKLVLRRILIGSILALLLAGPAGAGTIIVKLHFVPGKLTMSGARATLSAGNETQVPLTIADARGNGNGWTLQASVPVNVTSISVKCAANSTCTLPKLVTQPSGQIVLSAAKGTGMGIMNVVVTVSAPAKTAVSFAIS
jgi:hypothetical protein